MSHLNLEELARLADEEPTALEQAHLHDCATCRAELEQMRADVTALRGLGEIAPPADAWDGVEARLLAEGLIRRPTAGRAWPMLLRLAAALALFLTGTLAGFAWRSVQEPAPAVLASADTPRSGESARSGEMARSGEAARSGETPRTDETVRATDAARASDGPGGVAGRDAGVVAAGDIATADAGSGTSDMARRAVSGEGTRDGVNQPRTAGALAAAVAGRPAGATGAVDRARNASDAQEDESLPRIIGPASPEARLASLMSETPRTAEEAAMLLRDAESVYLDALARYAQLAGGAGESSDPLARLAALEGIVLTTREALGRAPADPVINGYHMTALAQREATLRQIAATSRNPWF